MKKYLNLIGMMALMSFNALSAKNSTPYNVPYTVKCYNKAGVRISCDKAMRQEEIVTTTTTTRRRVRSNRYYKNKYYRLKREMARIRRKRSQLAKLKANKKRKDDIRELALQNKKLEAEMQAMREAQRLATAKQTETPDTVILAPETVGANLNPEPITKTIVEEKVATDKEKKSRLFVALESWAGKSITETDASLGAGFDVNFGINLMDNLTLSIIPSFNMSFANGTNPGKFGLGDLAVNLEHSFYKKGALSMAAFYGFGLPTSQDSIANKKYLSVTGRLEIKTSLWNDKGYLRFRPGVAFTLREYATSAPTGTPDHDHIYSPPSTSSGSSFEILDPNEKYNVFLETKLGYTINKLLSTFVALNVKGQNMYADEVLSGGTILTLKPEEWKTNVTLTFPALGFNATDKVYFEVAVKTKAPLDKFSLFSPQDGNDTSINFFFMYTI